MAYRAGIEAFDWIKHGAEVANKDKFSSRINICNACEFFEKGRCKKCGCFMSAKAKLGTAKCPVGKW